MARIVIKESEIRNYIRSLIREGRKPIDFQPEINNGTFNLEKTQLMPGSKRWLDDFWKSKGVSKPRSYKWEGMPNRIIDYETGNLVNGNEIDAFLNNQRAKAAKKHSDDVNKNQLAKKGKISDDNNLTKDTLKNFGNTNPSTDGVKDVEMTDTSPQDDYTEKWLSMSDEERADARDAIMNARKVKQSADYDKYRNMQTSSLDFPSADEIRHRIAMLKDKQAALGGHNMVTDRKWKEYDYLIKDCEKILNKYYGGVNPTNSNDEMADEIVKNALDDDLSSAEEFKDTDFNAIMPNNNYGDYEPIDDETEDDDDKRSKKRDFKDAEENGFFDYDDDWEF